MNPHAFYNSPCVDSQAILNRALKCISQGEWVIFHLHGYKESCLRDEGVDSCWQSNTPVQEGTKTSLAFPLGF